MSVAQLLEEEGWDAPFFKMLASNDTGQAKGHQGGMVIPKDLRKYFPGLSGTTGPDNPTLSYRILAELYLESVHVDRVDTRYQYQTWGGTRNAESRLTDNLSPIRNKAGAGDVLVIQRDLEKLDHYRLVLVRRNSPEFTRLIPKLEGRRWGVLEDVPMAEEDLIEAQVEEQRREAEPFSLFDAGAQVIARTSRSIARSLAFRFTIQELYKERCAVCGTGLAIPEGRSELEAAHIVPRSQKGSDDARNGIGLCKRHHWAFDNGLFGLDGDRRIWVPEKVMAIPANRPLIEFHGKSIREAADPRLIASDQAMRWHIEHVVMRVR
jgi:putative restriction endonuclease